MKINKYWLASLIFFFAVTAAAACGLHIYTEKTEGVEELDLYSGVKNDVLAIDGKNGVIYSGTHDNLLVAWQNGKEIWRTESGGAYSELVLDVENDRLYAGNQDNHVYIYQASDGKLLLDINTQRKVMGLDVNSEGTKIAVVTNTGSSKANLIFYSIEGEELSNEAYTISLRGVKYCSDSETLLLSNKRGEVQLITEDGDVLDTYKTNYEIKDMLKNGEYFWVVTKNGEYYELTGDLECVRQGKISNTVGAIISSIGVDEEGEYVLVGTEEGYLFIMDGQDKQIYMEDLDVQITDFACDGDDVYFTGYGDFIKVVNASNLAHMDFYIQVVNVLRVVFYAGIVMLAVSLIGVFPASRRASAKLLKSIWKHKMAYIMLLPTFLLLFFFNYRGIFIALTRAFTNWSKTNNTVAKMDFIGLENFRTMFREGYFFTGMKNLLLLLVTGVMKTLTVPLAVAWLVYNIRGDRRKYAHRFLFVLPMVVPGVISAMIWQRIYDPSSGLINNLLSAMHLESLQRVWLGDSSTAIWAIVFMGFPFIGAMAFLVYYGGFINIGKEIEESAIMDGATKWKLFSRVQLPLIRPQLSIMVTLQIIGVMQDFNSIYILTGGGPGTSTYVPALELYLNVSQFGRYGYASALGIVLMIFTLAVTLISNRLTKGKE